ncbi:hypothetical protein CVS40_6622 [Lucilia cuprina]|nr:hypothetical protein CVS40_6622 [Lucilia cuprina]
MFSRLLNSTYFPKNTKLLLYKVAIRSVLTYAFPIWFSISPTVAKEIELLERNILRKCINRNFRNHTERFSNSFIYETASVTPFCKYALALQRKFVDRLADHENHLMNEIFAAQRDISWHDPYYLSPVGILNENIILDDAIYELPDFFRKSDQGTHRG